VITAELPAHGQQKACCLPAACGLLPGETESFKSRSSGSLSFPNLLPHAGWLIGQNLKLLIGKQRARFSWFSTPPPSEDFWPLLASLTLPHNWGTPLGLDFCCSWLQKLRALWSEKGTCPIYRPQSLLGPAVGLGMQRREASKVNVVLKLTTDLSSPQPSHRTSLNSIVAVMVICFLLSDWYWGLSPEGKIVY
jgi:hypothetical protein